MNDKYPYIYGFHTEEIEQMTIDYIENLSGRQVPRPYSNYTKNLTNWWYDVGIHNEDFYFYQTSEYIAIQIECFKDWTYERTQQMISFLQLGTKTKVNNIIDFGAGCGFSTLMLSEAFPKATIWYVDSNPWSVVNLLNLKKWFNVHNVEICTNLNQVNIIPEAACAFDVFEHFQKPLPVLQSLLLGGLVKYYFDSSSFHHEAPGHFRQYAVEVGNSDFVSGRYATHSFHTNIELLGYTRTEKLNHITYSNNRPLVFVSEPAKGDLIY